MKKNDSQSGVALISVVCFLALTGALIAILLKSAVSHYMMTGGAVDLEMALNVAEGGMERAVAHIASGGDTPITLSGTLGNGTYETTIIASDDEGNIYNGEHILGGELNINPNNSPDNEFTMTLSDGSVISRDMLGKNYPGYNGEAKYIHVKPKGNGNQNTLIMDGAPVDLENANTYDITAPALSVSLYNDKIVNGEAKGHWWLSINGSDVNISSSAGDLDQMPRAKCFNIISIGQHGDTRRRVTITGFRNMSWAQFALWSHDNRNIYFKSNEEFYGPVHANSKLWFSGDPLFHGEVTSSSETYGGDISDCTFEQGFQLDVPVDTMTDIPFGDLHSEAASGGAENKVIEDDTWIIMDGDDIYQSDSGDPDSYVLTEDSPAELIYVEGDLHISGQLDGRRTFVSDGDIYIEDHLTYAADPKVDTSSDDGLGLLTKKDIVVTEECPDNLNIYAHMMATGVATPNDNDGSFRVEDYNHDDPRGQLIVHGGIVQHYRGAVGTFSTASGQTTHGFEKNYTFDERFSINPPPHYPTLDDKYTFDNWEEGRP